jgi:hypothetical protein
MNKTLTVAALISPIIGMVVGYALSYGEISKLQSENGELEEAFEQLVKCFLIGDSNFTTSLDENVWWDVEAWHGNPIQ